MGVSLPGGGGKRGVDFDINLVPFIDLLSCLISFLLVTAVWTQLGRIDLNQPLPNPNDSEQPPVDEKKIKILIDKAGYYVNLPGEPAPRRIPLDADGVTYKRWELEDSLKKVKESDDLVKKVQFASADDAKYKEYIGVLDICLGLGLVDLQPMEADFLRENQGAPPGGAPPAPPPQ